MKKIVSIISALALCAALTACSSAGENESYAVNKRDLNDYKKVEMLYDGISLINTFEELESASELIVTGEFINNSKTCYLLDSSGYKKNGTHGYSSCPVKVTRVLAGDAQVGDVINVLQNEWYSNGKFYTLSRLTPMQMGDEWLFCLERCKDERIGDNNSYFCVSDNKGRYPTKNSDSNETMCFSAYPKLGVYKRSDFQEGFYNKLVEKYDF